MTGEGETERERERETGERDGRETGERGRGRRRVMGNGDVTSCCRCMAQLHQYLS